MAVMISVKNSGRPTTGLTNRMSKMRPGASAMASQNVTPHFQARIRPRMTVKTTHLKSAVEAVAAPRVHLVHAPVPAAPDPLLPELVVAGAVLADQVVDLAEDLEEEQRDQPPLGPQLVLQGLPEGHDRDLRVQVRGGQREEEGDEHEDLEPVPQHHREPGLRLPVVDLGLVHRLRGRRRGGNVMLIESSALWPLGPFADLTCSSPLLAARAIRFAHLTTFHEVAISLMASW